MINEGTSKEEIDETIAMFKEVVDELPLKPAAPDLSEIKAAAKAELNAYLAEGDYTALQIIDRNVAVSNGNAIIDAAATEDGVAVALGEAKALVDASLARVANYVDVTAMVKIVECYKPGGNFYLYVVFPELDAVTGDYTYNVKVGAVLDALGLWDNVYVGDRSLKDWGVTGGWDNDDAIGFNHGEPINNLYINCHSEEWKTSDVDMSKGILSNYSMTIKEGTLLPSQAVPGSVSGSLPPSPFPRTTTARRCWVNGFNNN